MRIAIIVLLATSLSCSTETGSPDKPKPGSAKADPSIGKAAKQESGTPSPTVPEVNAVDAITVNFHNLCDKAVTYAVVGEDKEPTDADARVIEASASIKLKKAKQHKIVRRNEDGSWGGGSASTDTDGGHILISSSCKGMAAASDPSTDPKTLDADHRKMAEAMEAKRKVQK